MCFVVAICCNVCWDVFVALSSVNCESKSEFWVEKWIVSRKVNCELKSELWVQKWIVSQKVNCESKSKLWVEKWIVSRNVNCESKSELYVCSLPLFILNRAGKNAAHTKLDSLVDSKHYAFFGLVEMRKSCIALEMMLRFLLAIKAFKYFSMIVSFEDPLSRTLKSLYTYIRGLQLYDT